MATKNGDHWSVALVFLFYLIGYCTCQTDVCIKVPEKTTNCLLTSKHQPVPRNSVIQACLHQLFWDYTVPQNLSAGDAEYFKALSRRFINDPSSPPSGFRQRKEYRQLGTSEREKLHRAFQILYDEGKIHRYGKLFGQAYPIVRHSPAFLGFQRVFLIAFEEELRRIDSSISLPYWDFTIDTEMDNPVNSILWSGKLFGNGNGQVTTGDFRDWTTPKGRIQRRYGESNYGRLISRDVVRDIASKCRTKDITYPVSSEAEEKYVLEFHHNGVMNWLGGTALDATTAAYDPVFYMISACTDYIWEVFRLIQHKKCKINPVLDYPSDNVHKQHKAFDSMFGFSELSNVYGFSNYWTRFWYNYTIAQGCPECASEYLWCNQKSFRCVAHSRRIDFNIGKYYVTDTEAFEPLSDYVPHKTEIPFMPSPLNDGRTMASARLDALRAVVDERALNARHRELLLFNALGGSSVLSDSLGGTDS